MRAKASNRSRRDLLKAGVAGMACLAASSGCEAQQPNQRGRMPRILVFDVNETLLNLEALEPQFRRVFGDARVMREWFNNVIQYSMVATLAGAYRNFAEIARAALSMTAGERGLTLSEQDSQQILAGIRSLPAHPDVAGGLQRLKAAGFRMVTLTNSPPATVDAQLAFAKLTEYFERSFSVDSVQKFKPAPEPYGFVAKELGVEPGSLRLIAAHAWDVAGAMQAGCSAAFVARPGKALFPLLPAPDIAGKDFNEIADAILKADSPKAA